MRQLLRVNFFVAVWLCIGSNLYDLWGFTTRVEELHLQFGPWMPRVIFAPLLIAGGELFLWFRFYRLGGSAAQVAAACAGIAFSIIVLEELLRASIDIPINASFTSLYAYFAASHFAYALMGRHGYRRPA
jgi:hypothetical protein